jgi:transposase-like protein
MSQTYQRPHPPESRRATVSVVKVRGRSVREVVGELGVSTDLLRWVCQGLDRGDRDGRADYRGGRDNPLLPDTGSETQRWHAFPPRLECRSASRVIASRPGAYLVVTLLE